MHLHLDAVGGVAGDMFVAALLDLAPQLADGAIAATRAAGLDEAVRVAHMPVDDGVMSGSRFVVSLPAGDDEPGDHAHARVHHDHVRWIDLRTRLAAAALAPKVRERAIAIFAELADAEARVHGRPIDAIGFHEVGAWDSIADIVAAAWLIEELGATAWSCGPLPLGSGRVRTAHGLLPVPAPATVLLLEGLPCFDDGEPGERITPTGAAILRHLAPRSGLGATPRVLSRTGHGFGTRRLRGVPNVLRVLTFEDLPAADCIGIDEITTLSFEVDDQTPEDLAVGLERLRAEPGVLDVVQGTVLAKQGRQAAAIRVLTEPAASEAVAAACFRETTTLGVRLARTERRVLVRETSSAADGVRVKRARRPGGMTLKAEISTLATAGDHAARERRRRAAEDSASRSDGGPGESSS
ncbi:MAG TPA: LarC family nickel insertion protein [Gammaproteobacteria bacterium]|nr:LarC family nickel insertion protein [Gammaproteobacteria bacterium]